MVLDVVISKIKSRFPNAEVSYSAFKTMPTITFFANDTEPCSPRYSNGERGVKSLRSKK